MINELYEPEVVKKVAEFLALGYSSTEIKEELEKINVKKQTMLDNMKKMNTTDFKKKYGNPTRIWAMLTWDIIKLKKQMESL